MSVEEMTETMQYLTFTLEEEVFAVNISQAREVLDYTKVTKVPRTPEFMLGVINLRGLVVPVIDMRLKFGLSKVDKTERASIVILEIALDGETTVLGALVDSVREVIDLEPEQIEPAPRIGTRLKTEFILGMGKQDEQFIIILDIDKVFSAEELLLGQIADGQEYTEQTGEGSDDNA